MTNCPSCHMSLAPGCRYCPTCGARIAPSLSQGEVVAVGPGTLLGGRYLVVAPLGAGAMGTVWRGEDTRLHGRPCAIKALTVTALSGDDAEEATTWFEREIAVLSGLRHPAICDVLDAVPEGNNRYLILELIDGHTLADELARRGTQGLPLADVLRWGTTLGDALGYLHGRRPPLVFRDLKPANIMLRPDGQVVLIDFGIARPISRAGATAIGTGGYAPPEQYQGLAEPRSDVYGLAATLHHLLTGCDPTTQVPFTFPPLCSLAPGLPADLESVVTCALSMRPEDRFPDIGAFVAALADTHRVGANLGRVGRASPAAPSAAPQSSLVVRYPTVAPDPARSFVLCPAYTVERRNRPQHQPLPAALVLLEDDRLWVLTGSALWDPKAGLIVRELGLESARPASLSKDGRYLAQYLSGRLAVWRTFQPTATKLAGPPGYSEPAFSPDGSLLAACSRQSARDVTCWDVDTGEVALELQGHTGSVGAFEWHSDSTLLVTAAADRTLRLWDTVSGQTKRRLKGFDEPPDLLTFSPSDELLASDAGLRKDPYAIRLWDTATGKELDRFRDHPALLNGLAFSPEGAVLASWSDDGVVNLWPMEDGAPEWPLEGHEGPVNDAAFSPDGGLLASAGEDGTIALWDVETGRQLHRLEDEAGGAVVTVVFSPSGKSLASVSENDAMVRIWHI